MSHQYFDKIFCWFYAHIVRPSKLPVPESQSNELRKLALARIAVGLVVLARTSLSAFAAYYYFEPSSVCGITANYHFIASILMLCCVTAFTLGFFAPLSTLLTLIFYPEWDKYMFTTTLGTMILVHLLILLLFTNSGLYYSLDRELLKGKWPLIRSALRAQYGILGEPSRKQISCYYFLTFAAYAVTSFGALTHHVMDEYWRSGMTVERLMTSSFLSSQYLLTRKIQHLIPGPFAIFSKLSVIGQSIYQLFMLVLVYTPYGYLFVLFWGGLFFLISWCSLQLSYLAPLELIMWLVVMCPTPQKFFLAEKETRLKELHTQKKAVTGVLIAGFAVICLPFVCQFSLFRSRFPNFQLPPLIASGLYRVGFWCPDVFNRTDLGMSDNWCVIYRCYKDGHTELVPFNNVDGSRGVYYYFDPLYFGNGLVYRRRFVEPGFNIDEMFKSDGNGYQYVEKVLQFDHKLLNGKAPDFYRIQIISTDEKYTHRKGLENEVNIPGKVIFQYDRRI